MWTKSHSFHEKIEKKETETRTDLAMCSCCAETDLKNGNLGRLLDDPPEADLDSRDLRLDLRLPLGESGISRASSYPGGMETGKEGR